MSFNFILTRYGLERLLFRLASSHRDQFVLKGAMLFPALVRVAWGRDSSPSFVVPSIRIGR